MARNAKNTRMCAACRLRADKSMFIYICRQKDGRVFIPKEGERAEGRGMYLCKKLKCAEIAKKKNFFGRNLRGEIPDGFIQELEMFVKSLNAE